MTGSKSASFVRWPPSGSSVSVATWLREFGGLVASSVAPAPFPDDAARGRGEPVIVVPGFCSPDVSTARLRAFLARQGFAMEPWNCGLNIGPRETTLARLEAQVRALRARTASRVSLVGVSLGGTLAREVAKRCPDQVTRVITLCSPVNLPVATPLAPLAHLTSLFWDPQAHRALPSIAKPPPVPVTAIVTRRDGVVDWRACLPVEAGQLEIVMVEGAHMTMGSNPQAQRIIAARLAGTGRN